jgi:protein-tyrosine kinase
MRIVERAILKQRASGAAPAGLSTLLPQADVPVAAPQGESPAERSRVQEPFVPGGGPLEWDEARFEQAGLLASPEFRSLHRSQYRGIRRVLLDRIRDNANEFGARSRAVAVTSALAGEGKTFTSFNLASNLARDPEYQVLLIDTDLARRSMSKALGIGGRPGVSECLLDPAQDVAQLAMPLADRLSVLGAGCRYMEAGDRIATTAFPQLLERLLVHHPRLIVVMDAGPLLLSAEAEVVTARAGAALLVVRAGSTPRSAVRDAMERVPKHVPAAVLLNAWQPGSFGDPERYYGDYYDYAE